METKILNLFGEQPPQRLKLNHLTFNEVFREFNLVNSKENDHSQGTAYKYENFQINFLNFLTSVGKEQIPPDQINISLLKSFVIWLGENLKSCSKTHVSKHIYRINKALDSAVIDGIIPYNPCAAYIVKRGKNKAVVNLDGHEFLTWLNHKWHLPIYQTCQEYFIMQMSAGLSYMDIFNYKTVTDKHGVWIESRRGKTGKVYYVPIWHPEFELARSIHEKYNGKIPKIENHNYNRLIREMAAQLGIDKYLTTHIGRKTFATLKDESGWELGPIASMLGNTNKVCESHYINGSKKKIERELLKRA